MKYYIYISESKVEMLLSQIPHAVKKKIAAEIKVDLKLLSVSRKSETESEDNRFTKLEAVVSFIREYGKLGSVDEPNDYVEDDLLMRWGPYGFASDGREIPLVYFGGATEKTIVGLGGSTKHLIGYSSGQSHPHSHSATPNLVSYLENQLEITRSRKIPPSIFNTEKMSEQRIENLHLRAVYLATSQMSGPQQRLEFVAKRLLYGRMGTNKQILLASPIYVAMVE